ncbi:MAG: Spy/CpxP family protein refolding chaperone [Pyrinomonadaceae bacterium]
MKLNWKTFSVAATIAGALLLTTAAVVFSQNPPQRPDGPPGPPRGPFGHGPHGPRGPGGFGPLAGLNLTDAQKEQIKQIHEGFAEQTKALRDQMRTLHESQRDPMSNFDEAAVRSGAEARAKVRVEMEVAHAKMMSQVVNVLTAEQRAQMAERQKHRPQGPPRPPAPPNEPEF